MSFDGCTVTDAIFSVFGTFFPYTEVGKWTASKVNNPNLEKFPKRSRFLPHHAYIQIGFKICENVKVILPMAALELSRIEARLRVLVKELALRLEACEQQQTTLTEQIATIHDHMRAVKAKEGLQNASIQQNPIYENEEESDGSV